MPSGQSQIQEYSYPSTFANVLQVPYACRPTNFSVNTIGLTSGMTATVSVVWGPQNSLGTALPNVATSCTINVGNTNGPQSCTGTDATAAIPNNSLVSLHVQINGSLYTGESSTQTLLLTSFACGTSTAP